MTTVDIDILHQAGDWPDVAPLIEKSVRAALDHGMDDTEDPLEISILLADDPFIQDLNKTYRGQDKPTNVLSFPQDEPYHLGDVILAYETLAREASEQDKKFEDHLAHLSVHGTLHLLGFDHETPEEAEEMEALEINVLTALGVDNPYK